MMPAAFRQVCKGGAQRIIKPGGANAASEPTLCEPASERRAGAEPLQTRWGEPERSGTGTKWSWPQANI